jgi:hypothetical protein
MSNVIVTSARAGRFLGGTTERLSLRGFGGWLVTGGRRVLHSATFLELEPKVMGQASLLSFFLPRQRTTLYADRTRVALPSGRPIS